MRRTIAAVLLLSTATPALAQEGQQQRPCAPLDQVEAYLASEYQETRVGQGVMANGRAMLMLYASPSGTWTALMVNPEKIACQVADGTDYQVRNDAPAVPEQGS
jgi:hypothetical protein